MKAIASSNITIALLHTARAGAGMARVIADITHNATSRDNPQEVYAAFASAVDGKAQLLPETIRVLDENRYSQRIVAHVALNREVVAVSEGMKGFRAVAANMFMDTEDKMWTLRKTQGGDVLIQATDLEDDETLARALSSLSSVRHDPTVGRFAAQCSAVAASVQGGDFISYVSFDNKVKFGYVAVSAEDSDELLLVPTEGEEETINKDAVLDNEGEPEVEESEEDQVEAAVASARGAVSVEQIVAYYKRIYGRNQKYFAELTKRIRGHKFGCC